VIDPIRFGYYTETQVRIFGWGKYIIMVRILFWIQNAAAVFVLIVAWGCTRPAARIYVIGEDAVSIPERPITVTARLQQRNIFLKELEGKPLHFKLVSSPGNVDLNFSKTGITDDEGRAAIQYGLHTSGLYEFEVSYPGDQRYQSGQDATIILAADPAKPLLVLDLDGTITKKSWLASKPEPVPYDQDTVRVINLLARTYTPVYLSARPKPIHKKTHTWLKKYGFPDGPVLMWYPSEFRWLRPYTYKKDMLIDLDRAGINVCIGISNTEGDMKAYRKAGMLPILLGKKSRRYLSADNWAGIEEILLGGKDLRNKIPIEK